MTIFSNWKFNHDLVNFWGSGKSKNKRLFRLPVKFPKSPICVASCYLRRGRDGETRVRSEKEASRTQHLHHSFKANWANWTVGPRNDNCYDKHLKDGDHDEETMRRSWCHLVASSPNHLLSETWAKINPLTLSPSVFRLCRWLNYIREGIPYQIAFFQTL